MNNQGEDARRELVPYFTPMVWRDAAVDLVPLILSEAEKQKAEEGEVQADVGDKTLPKVRSVVVRSFPEGHWIYGICSYYTNVANSRKWQYAIDSVESPQVLTYVNTDHYTWHADMMFQASGRLRKLTTIIALSDPDDYVGGELEIRHAVTGEPEQIADFTKGSVLVFPSNLVHRVKPLISGKRQVLVNWALGPPLR